MLHDLLECPRARIGVLGKPGIGKSYTVRDELEKAGFEPLWLTSSCVSNGREAIDYIQKAAKTDLINEMRAKCDRKRRIVVIDDIDILCNLDRSFLTALLDFLKCTGLRIPIIFIGPIAFEKKLPGIQVVHLPEKTVEEISAICGSLEAARMCDGNITYALSLSNPVCRLEDPCLRDVSLEANDMLKLQTTDLRILLLQDPWLHPLRFHENLIGEMKNRKGTKELLGFTYLKMLGHLCDWDYYLSFSSADHDVAVEHILACNALLQSLPKKKTAAKVQANIEFTKIFSHLSLHKKRMRQNYKDDFPWHDTGY